MNEAEILEVKIINVKKYMILVFFYVIGGSLGLFLLALHLRIPSLMLIGLFAFIILPVVFLKTFRKAFVRNSVISFHDASFSIQLFNRKTEGKEEEHEYHYLDIKSYMTTEQVRDHSSSLKLYLKNGSKVEYTFVEQRYNNESDVIYKFAKQVKIYNAHNSGQSEIKYHPNLFATTIGGYLIAILGVCWIGLILFFVIYKHKALAPTTIGGILLFVQILFQRKRDLDKIAEEHTGGAGT